MGLFDTKQTKGEVNMDILKEEINKLMDNLNQEWVNALKKGEREGGIDLSEMFGKYSHITSEVDKAFQLAKKRGK